MRKKLLLAMLMTLVLSAMFVGTVAAHDVDAAVADTPLTAAPANAVDNYVAALSNSGGAAANSLFRNPTCDAHESPAGIHPPGNP